MEQHTPENQLFKQPRFERHRQRRQHERDGVHPLGPVNPEDHQRHGASGIQARAAQHTDAPFAGQTGRRKLGRLAAFDPFRLGDAESDGCQAKPDLNRNVQKWSVIMVFKPRLRPAHDLKQHAAPCGPGQRGASARCPRQQDGAQILRPVLSSPALSSPGVGPILRRRPA